MRGFKPFKHPPSVEEHKLSYQKISANTQHITYKWTHMKVIVTFRNHEAKGTMNLRTERPNVHTIIRDGEIGNAGEGGVPKASTAGLKWVAESTHD